MNAGKKQYEQIPIPEELDRVIWDSIGRAAREARRRRLRRWGLSAAAVFCAKKQNDWSGFPVRQRNTDLHCCRQTRWKTST